MNSAIVGLQEFVAREHYCCPVPMGSRLRVLAMATFVGIGLLSKPAIYLTLPLAFSCKLVKVRALESHHWWTNVLTSQFISTPCADSRTLQPGGQPRMPKTPSNPAAI